MNPRPAAFYRALPVGLVEGERCARAGLATVNTGIARLDIIIQLQTYPRREGLGPFTHGSFRPRKTRWCRNNIDNFGRKCRRACPSRFDPWRGARHSTDKPSCPFFPFRALIEGAAF